MQQHAQFTYKSCWMRRNIVHIVAFLTLDWFGGVCLAALWHRHSKESTLHILNDFRNVNTRSCNFSLQLTFIFQSVSIWLSFFMSLGPAPRYMSVWSTSQFPWFIYHSHLSKYTYASHAARLYCVLHRTCAHWRRSAPAFRRCLTSSAGRHLRDWSWPFIRSEWWPKAGSKRVEGWCCGVSGVVRQHLRSACSIYSGVLCVVLYCRSLLY